MGELRRSFLLVGADDQSLGEKLTWNPDVVVLDYTDLLHPSSMRGSMNLISDKVSFIQSEGIEPMVQIRAITPFDDLQRLVGAGVETLIVSGFEQANQVGEMSSYLDRLESEVGPLKLIPYLANIQSVYNVLDIVNSDPRIIAVAIGIGDLAFDLLESYDNDMFYFTGPNPRISSPEFLITRTTVMANSKNKCPVMGVLGNTIASGFAQADQLEKAADRAVKLGIKSFLTPHNEGLDATRKAFINQGGGV